MHNSKNINVYTFLLGVNLEEQLLQYITRFESETEGRDCISNILLIDIGFLFHQGLNTLRQVFHVLPTPSGRHECTQISHKLHNLSTFNLSLTSNQSGYRYAF